MEKKVAAGDGAEWIWKLADQQLPGAIQIVDLYHARQHLWEEAPKLYPNDEVKQKRRIMVRRKRAEPLPPEAAAFGAGRTDGTGRGPCSPGF